MGTHSNCCFKKNFKKGTLPLRTFCRTKISTQLWWFAMTKYHSFVERFSGSSICQSIGLANFKVNELIEIQLLALAFNNLSQIRFTIEKGKKNLKIASAKMGITQNSVLITWRRKEIEPTSIFGKNLDNIVIRSHIDTRLGACPSSSGDKKVIIRL